MTKQAIKKIKELCSGRIQFVRVEGEYVIILLPYDSAEYDILIEGDTVEEQVECFISEVNGRIDDMIDYLRECRLKTKT